MLFNFCSILYRMGFYKTGEKYVDQLYEQTNDSTYYHWAKISQELDLGNFKSAAGEAEKAFRHDSTKSSNLFYVANTYIFLRNYDEAYRLIRKCMENKKDQGLYMIPNPGASLGFIYSKYGRNEEADSFFNRTVRQKLRIIDLNQPYSTCRAHFDLIQIYAAMDEKDKALENLRQAKDCRIKIALPPITAMKVHPMYDSIRNEPEFIELLKELEADFQTEREKVKKLLQDESILVDR